MNYIILFSVMAVGAYGIQFLLTLAQIQHFNKIYSELRKKGKVAIGTRPGKMTSGTIVMFAIDDQAKILDARKMQGVTVLAKFKPLSKYVGQDMHFIDHKHPFVRQENKLTRVAMEDARDLFIKVTIGDYTETQKPAPLNQLVLNTKIASQQLFNKVKRSA